eukprot:gnl/TRDRNA2_/TRDRNA2_194059_c0_seq1.p1 gnl/TRDRNA2_/TRDRNA2_194059_c0~~gnl/TRDRNA2_/TRDRNA2_194059_c0_seq1.p1  ORF type:complete len:727 (+),score=87.66 gnl/TRDRNA2_/TRDRNA2_194059_c0_seq1:301-2181(+)
MAASTPHGTPINPAGGLYGGYAGPSLQPGIATAPGSERSSMCYGRLGGGGRGGGATSMQGAPLASDEDADVVDGAPQTPTQPANRKGRPRRSTSPQTHAPGRGSGFNNQCDTTVMPISHLSPYATTWRIRTRIISKSDVRHFVSSRGKGQLFSVEVVDSTGGQCRLTFFGGAVDKFFTMLSPRGIYEFSGGMVKQANPRFTRHPIEITFDERQATVMAVADDGSIPGPRYDFVELATLPSLAPGTSIDVAAVVKEAQQDIVSVTTKKGDTRSMLSTTLVDSSGASCKFTLWGRHADEHVGAVTPGSIIFVGQARISEFGGGRSLESSDMAYIDLNPDDPRAFALTRWFAEHGSNPVQSLTPGGGSRAPRLLLAECKHKDQTLVSSVNKNPGMPPSERSGATHFHRLSPLTVLKVNYERPPYYVACTVPVPTSDGGRPRLCHKKVQQMGHSWQCSGGHMCQEPETRYVLRVLVADPSSPATWLSVFDEGGQQLLGCPASHVRSLFEQRDEGNIDAGKQLDVIFQRACYQRISVNVKSKNETYQGVERVKMSMTDATPVDLAADAKEMLGEVLGACTAATAAAGGFKSNRQAPFHAGTGAHSATPLVQPAPIWSAPHAQMSAANGAFY